MNLIIVTYLLYLLVQQVLTQPWNYVMLNPSGFQIIAESITGCTTLKSEGTSGDYYWTVSIGAYITGQNAGTDWGNCNNESSSDGLWRTTDGSLCIQNTWIYVANIGDSSKWYTINPISSNPCTTLDINGVNTLLPWCATKVAYVAGSKLSTTLYNCSSISFLAVTTNTTNDYYIRNCNYEGYLSQIDSSSLDFVFINSSSLIGDPNYVSFESYNLPGYYLINDNGRLRIDQLDSSTLFMQDASFKIVDNLSAVNYSYNLMANYSALQSYSDPSSYVTWIPSNDSTCDMYGDMYVEQYQNDADYINRVSFKIVPAYIPKTNTNTNNNLLSIILGAGIFFGCIICVIVCIICCVCRCVRSKSKSSSPIKLSTYQHTYTQPNNSGVINKNKIRDPFEGIRVFEYARWIDDFHFNEGTPGLALNAASIFADKYPRKSCIDEILTCGLSSRLKEFQLIISLCKKLPYKLNHLNLDDNELMALYIYTSNIPNGKIEYQFYYNFNIDLREATNVEEIGIWKGYIFYLFNALRKFPNVNCIAYRGLKIKEDEINIFTNKYLQGKYIEWGSFASTTTDSNISKDFSSGSEIPVIFIIKISNGKDIKNYSMFPQENEILLCPSTFLVTKEIYKENGFFYVHLTEK